MRVLLIRQTMDYTNPSISQAMGVIATILHEDGHNIKAIDNNSFYKYYSNSHLVRVAKKFDPDVIAFNITINSTAETYRLLSRFKSKLHHKIYVAGGIHMKLHSEEAMRYGFDIVVPRDGELVVTPLFRHLEGKNRDNFRSGLEKIPGVSFIKENGEIHHATDFPFVKNLDDVPLINYNLLNIRDYIRTRKEPGLLLINGERGCPFGCTFCSDKFQRQDNRITSADYMFRNVRQIYEDYGLTYFSIVDTNFLLKRQRVVDFCHKIIEYDTEKKFVFTCQLKIDSNLDKELVLLMKRAGFFKFYFGLERLIPYSLQQINKNTSLDDIHRIFKLLKKNDLQIHINILLGFPFETVDLIRKERKAFESIMSYVQTFYVNILMPTPGTPYYDDYPKAHKWYLKPEFNAILKSYHGHVMDLNMLDMLEMNFYDFPQEVIQEIRDFYLSFKTINHGKIIVKQSITASLLIKLDYLLAQFSRLIHMISPSFEFLVFRNLKAMRYFFGVMLLRNSEK